jgi:2-haloacid dehalogenase
VKLEVIFFDADDTLINFIYAEEHSFRTVLKRNGLEAEADKLLKSYKEISRKMWVDFEKGRIDKETLRIGRYERFCRKFALDLSPFTLAEEYLDELPHHTKLMEGVEELFDHLKSLNIPIGIMTNGFSETQRKRLNRVGLMGRIQYLIISEEVGSRKPEIEVYNAALAEAEVSDPSQAMIVGDRLETDIIGGLRAGWQTVWFNPRGREKSIDVEPGLEIRALRDLKEALK